MFNRYILGGNWSAPIVWPGDDDDGDDGDGPADPEVIGGEGFPDQVPVLPDHPEFIWNGRNNGNPRLRRLAFERSITRISLTASRNKNRPKGRDIDPHVYRQIQDNENKETCRLVFFILEG